MDVSIIIPTMNEERYIGQCLDSIADQEFNGSYEIVVGDGESDDRTVEICEDYGAKVVFEPKPTIAAGRQKACDAAKGRIIVSTDADIKATPLWLDKIVSGFDGNVAVYGNVVPYDGSNAERWFCAHVMDLYLRAMHAIGNHVPVGSNLAFRHDAFDAVGGFDTDAVTAEDLDLVKRLRHEGTIAYKPDNVVYASMRRVKKWGYLGYVGFHLTNALKYHATGKGHSSYEQIR